MHQRATTMTVTEFKAKCLRLVDDLVPSGIVLTKHGRPVARVIPAGPCDNRDLIGALKGNIAVKGNLFRTGVTWHAEPRHARACGAGRRPTRTP
jgi:antitoxin (DNA-binding transcriptional repressor) of toxin-antitoxin stability system